MQGRDPGYIDTDLRYFSRHEPGLDGGRFDRMDSDFMRALDMARDVAEVPFEITDSFREDGSGSSHTLGLAVDIRAHSSYVRFRIVLGLLSAGFERIGVYDRHVHACGDPERPRFSLWLGVSR